MHEYSENISRKVTKFIANWRFIASKIQEVMTGMSKL
jgi:hypothetical protein